MNQESTTHTDNRETDDTVLLDFTADQDGGRARLTQLLAESRASGTAFELRAAEAFFMTCLVSPANHAWEPVVQICKHARYETTTPVEATLIFCEALHGALTAAGKQTSIKPLLGENEGGALDEIWQMRQHADFAGWPYEDWSQAVVENVHLCQRGPIVTATDLACISEAVEQKLETVRKTA